MEPLHRCPKCRNAMTSRPVKWLASDFPPSASYQCIRCIEIWYVFDVVGQPSIAIAESQKPYGKDWDAYVEERLVARGKN